MYVVVVFLILYVSFYELELDVFKFLVAFDACVVKAFCTIRISCKSQDTLQI